MLSNYRRLLWAYPRSYRRQHGAEIVTTLLEMAEARGGRPPVGEALHLVACGIRQRFRVPRRPFALVAAVLTALVLGALGSVAGTWLGWQTAASAPSTAEAKALGAAASSRPGSVSVERWKSAMGGPGVNTEVYGGGVFDPARVRAALAADGWRITRFDQTDAKVIVDFTTTPWTTTPERELIFAATRRGLTLHGTAAAAGDRRHADLDSMSLDVTVDPTGAIRPLTIAGLLAGALAGWMVSAALARRTRFVPGAVALAAAGVPAFVAYGRTYQVMIYDTHAPDQYVTDALGDHVPPALLLAGTVIGVLAVMATLVIGPRRRPEPNPIGA